MKYQRLTVSFVLVFVIGICITQAEARKPNFLFIFADDQAYDTIRSHGQHEIHTPNLDRLVSSGLTFTHAYNQGGYHGAVCVASRTMLNTGLYLWNARAAEGKLKSEYQAKGMMWSQLLGKAGYESYFTGKWHVKADTNVIFTKAQNVRGGMPNQTKEGYNRPIDGKPDPWSPYDPKFGGFWKGGKHWSEVVGDDAVEFLGHAAKRDNPFFMYIAFNAPHDPRQAPKKFVDMYPINKIALPEPFMPEYPWKDAMGCGKGLRDEKLAPFPRTERSVKINRQEYYAIITHMDEQIGRILDALDKTGKADNTYIFFTADHGLGCGHHGLMGKQNVFDHSIRVPFMIAGPGVAKNKKNSAPIYMQDVMPTTLELAGVDKPDYVQFESLMPLVKGEKKQSRDAIYSAYVNKQRAVTMGDWKYITYPTAKKELLFNLKSDPWETKDLAGDSAHTSRIADMKARLQQLQKETGDTLDLDAPVPVKKPRKKKTK